MMKKRGRPVGARQWKTERVYLALSNFCPSGKVTAYNAKIAKIVGFPIRTVQRCLADLIKDGRIRRLSKPYYQKGKFLSQRVLEVITEETECRFGLVVWIPSKPKSSTVPVKKKNRVDSWYVRDSRTWDYEGMRRSDLETAKKKKEDKEKAVKQVEIDEENKRKAEIEAAIVAQREEFFRLSELEPEPIDYFTPLSHEERIRRNDLTEKAIAVRFRPRKKSDVVRYLEAGIDPQTMRPLPKGTY